MHYRKSGLTVKSEARFIWWSVFCCCSLLSCDSTNAMQFTQRICVGRSCAWSPENLPSMGIPIWVSSRLLWFPMQQQTHVRIQVVAFGSVLTWVDGVHYTVCGSDVDKKDRLKKRIQRKESTTSNVNMGRFSVKSHQQACLHCTVHSQTKRLCIMTSFCQWMRMKIVSISG